MKAGDWVAQTWQDGDAHKDTRAIFSVKSISDTGLTTLTLPNSVHEYTCKASDLRVATEEEIKKAQEPRG